MSGLFHLGAVLLTLALPGTGALTEPSQPVESTETVQVATSTAAERAGRAYLELVNQSTSSEVRAFVEAWMDPSAPGQLSAENWLLAVGLDRYHVGGTEVVRFEPTGPYSGDLIFRSLLTGRSMRLGVEVEPAPPYRIRRLSGPDSIMDTPSPMPDSDDDFARRLDAYVERFVEARSFSGVILVARGDEVIFQNAYGDAEWRFGVPNDLETRFYSGSIAKSFAAVAIAQLVEQGRLSWTDSLARFLPDFPTPEAAQRIEIRHLLTHTSGLGAVFSPAARMQNLRSLSDYMAVASRTPPTREPGVEWSYSNLGYLLLGRIVEIVSGEDYYSYVERHILQPAEMTASGFQPRDSGVARYAYGYEPDYSVDGLTFRETLFDWPARGSSFGGAYVTARDLLRFDRALRSGRLVQPATFDAMRRARPEIGAPGWGYGLAINEPPSWGGRSSLGHGGAAPGACTRWETIEDAGQPYTFIILANSGLESCFPIIDQMFELIPAA